MPGIAGVWARSFGFTLGEYQALHPHISSVSREQINRVHRLKRRVHVWTANQPQEIVKLKEWGADGIFTDDPAMALKALGRSG
jgi:glycerophosphoryl diester phosphodiesterase